MALGVVARKGDLGLRNSERSPYLAPRRVGAHPPSGGKGSLRIATLQDDRKAFISAVILERSKTSIESIPRLSRKRLQFFQHDPPFFARRLHVENPLVFGSAELEHHVFLPNDKRSIDQHIDRIQNFIRHIEMPFPARK